MTTTTAMPAPARAVTRLDWNLLKRTFLYLAFAMGIVSPFTPDPVAFAVGGAVPLVLVHLVGRPTMPMAVVYLFVWQWAQTFARALQAVFDGESMAAGIYGPDVLRAYWYMLASLVSMAIAFRLVLSRIRAPTVEEFYAHERWRPNDMIMVYVVALVGATMLSFVGRVVGALDQPMEAAARVKIVALFVLATYVFTSGRGGKFLLAAVLFEILVGFTGFLSDFRGVFIYIAIAAMAARIRWTGTATVLGLAWLGVLLSLALFWTSVKQDYRSYVTGDDEHTQAISVPLDERMAYLGDKFLNIGDTDWGTNAYLLLIRFAYVDIFGQVINVADHSPPNREALPQWKAALGHVFQPRFLFPNKAPLSDTEVFMRLTRADPMENIRLGTSISVGYLAENFVDLGFPGMLAGTFVLGLGLAWIIRYFMGLSLPWMMREAIIMGFAFSMARDGVEVSLPKVLGAMVMFFVVWALICRYALPYAMRWLDTQAARDRARAR